MAKWMHPLGKVLSAACVIAVTFVASVAAPAAMADAAFDGVAERVLRDYLRPAYQSLDQQSDRMVARVEAFCASPGDRAAKEALDAQFLALVESWSRVEFIRFGPVVARHRYERLFLWPDVKGRGLRQVRRLLAARDPVIDDPVAYRKKSVALQGLPALDYVLFDKGAVFGAKDEDGYRCRVAEEIAGSIHATARSLRKDWEDDAGYARLMTAPGPDNPVYRDEREVARELITSLVSGLEALRDRKLLVALGRGEATPKPRRLPFRRSGLALEALAANLQGLGALYAATGFDEAVDQENEWLQDTVPFEFKNAERVLASIPLSAEEAVATPEAAEKLRYVSVVIGTLDEMIGTDLSTAIDLKAGFNALDGD